jgi:hypothetical protein
MPYSLGLTLSGLPSIVTERAVRSMARRPVRITEPACPFERRTIALSRAISSSLANGLVR